MSNEKRIDLFNLRIKGYGVSASTKDQLEIEIFDIRVTELAKALLEGGNDAYTLWKLVKLITKKIGEPL